MADSVTIEGLDVFARALKVLPDNISRKILRGAVAAGAKIIRDEARVRAPVYAGEIPAGHPPSGTLKRAISFGRSNKRSKKGVEICNVFVRQAMNGNGRGQKRVKAYGKFDAYYWYLVEFGTSKMSARPFMRPAFEAKKDDAVAAIAQSIADRFPQEAEKLGWKFIKK